MPRETSLTTAAGGDFNSLMAGVAERIAGWTVDFATHAISPAGCHYVTVYLSREMPAPTMGIGPMPDRRAIPVLPVPPPPRDVE